MERDNYIQIYIYLPDEPIDVWRPVNAVQISETLYQIVSQNSFDDENWQFKTGEIVRCKERILSDKKYIVAYERISNENADISSEEKPVNYGR